MTPNRREFSTPTSYFGSEFNTPSKHFSINICRNTTTIALTHKSPRIFTLIKSTAQFLLNIFHAHSLFGLEFSSLTPKHDCIFGTLHTYLILIFTKNALISPEKDMVIDPWKKSTCHNGNCHLRFSEISTYVLLCSIGV